MAFVDHSRRRLVPSLSSKSSPFHSSFHSMNTASSPELSITRSPSPYSQHTVGSPPDYTCTDGQASSRLARARHFLGIWDSLPGGDTDARPQHPYTDLIKLCVLKRCDTKLTLNQLYQDLEEKFPFFASPKNGKGWKNTLRHNLSTQPYFIKLDREHGQSGKGHYWTYEPHLEKPSSLAQSSILQHAPSWCSLLLAPHQSKASQIRDQWTRTVQSGPIVPSSEIAWDNLTASQMQYSRQQCEHRHYRQLKHDEETKRATNSRRQRQTRSDESFQTPVLPPTMPVRVRSHTHSGVGGADRLRTKLYHLPAVPPRRSMGDFYLSNPISSTSSASQRRQNSPY